MSEDEEKQLKADIMRKTMHSMDTRARTEVTVMAELIALRAWKEKARPFLLIQHDLMERSEATAIQDHCRQKYTNAKNEITELLKEGE
jgi:hypothetical protein